MSHPLNTSLGPVPASGTLAGAQNVTLGGTIPITAGGFGSYYNAGQAALSMADEISHLAGRGLSLRIVHATGGTIVAVKDEGGEGVMGRSDLYVIADSSDLGTEIGKILTMHYLKREQP
jgi:hypothetical protein